MRLFRCWNRSVLTYFLSLGPVTNSTCWKVGGRTGTREGRREQTPCSPVTWASPGSLQRLAAGTPPPPQEPLPGHSPASSLWRLSGLRNRIFTVFFGVCVPLTPHPFLLPMFSYWICWIWIDLNLGVLGLLFLNLPLTLPPALPCLAGAEKSPL